VKKPSPTRTVVAYLRVSTEEQAQSRAGLDAQRAAITSESATRGWKVLKWFTDQAASGKSLNGRPELAKALETVRGGKADGLVVAKLDRLSRSMKDFATLVDDAQQHGWNLIVLDPDVDLSTPSGQFTANIMASVAQLERQLIGQRTRDALAAKRAQGVRLGRPRTLPDHVRTRILKAHKNGHSLSAIARDLNNEEIPTAQGGTKWHPSTIKQILTAHDTTTKHR
jgi:DNA invertase Pin-like site-specific DNA recombinase